MKTLVIADIRSVVKDGDIPGHFVPVAQNYMEVLRDKFHVQVAGGEVYSKHFQRETLIRLPYCITGDGILDKIKLLLNSLFLFKKAGQNTIVIQQASLVTTFLAIALFFWNTGKIYLIIYNTSALKGTIKRILYKLAQNKISGIICSSDQIGKLYGKPYCVVTDFIRTEIPQFKSFEERKYDFCFVGGIYDNKGIVEAADFLKNKCCKFLIAGKDNESGIGEKLLHVVGQANNIELKMKYISTLEYNECLADSKYCILNYRGTYEDRSSGVVLDAILSGTPVVGSDCKALELVKTNRVGYTYKDIKDLDINFLLVENTYRMYIDNIKRYFAKQQDYAQQLASFLG